jgi:Holliday junction resolvasome RuvABC ATP-dependent DNA helicase subunit
MDYNNQEKQQIIQKYLEKYQIKHQNTILEKIAEKVDSVPREIHNLCIKIRDFVISKKANEELNETNRMDFLLHSQIDE